MKFHFRTIEPWPGVPLSEWKSWSWQFRRGLTSAADFSKVFELSDDEREALSQPLALQVRSTPYYAALAAPGVVDDPVRRMIVPRLKELSTSGQQVSDPLGERRHSPRERLIHRYPDRVLFLVTDQCSLYCRYCLRKHFTGQEQAFVGSADYEAALQYLRGAYGVREVILSGGDPMTLSDGRLERVLSDLRAIGHLEIIRIGTRMPVVCPMRFTDETVALLRRYKPVYLMTHFNHPRELSADAAEALEKLVDHGVPVFNQMVLLNGVNNHAAIVQALSRRLLYLRVKPYYMFQCDPSEGSEHFRTSVAQSLEIQRELWGRLSGLAMPNLSLDIPGGGGKVGLVPNFKTGEGEYVGWDGVGGEYLEPRDPLELPADLGDYLCEWEQIKTQRYGRNREASEERRKDPTTKSPNEHTSPQTS
jgi:lysine 2,3-aminomutase